MNTAPIVFITGASSGIGRATAVLFANKGWQVIATMRDIQNAGSLTDHKQITVLALDVTNKNALDTVVRDVIKRFGQIDVLINNAGYALLGPFEAASKDEITQQFSVNVHAVMHLIRAVIPHMRNRKSGTIINISSIAGRMSFPFYSYYDATKWAIEGISESLLHEVKPFGIRVKLIEPGPIATDFYARSAKYSKREDLGMYDTAMEKTFAGMGKQRSAFVGTPEAVAQTIFHAATDTSFRLRYPAGRIAWWLLLFRKILPDRLFFFVLSQFI